MLDDEFLTGNDLLVLTGCQYIDPSGEFFHRDAIHNQLPASFYRKERFLLCHHRECVSHNQKFKLFEMVKKTVSK